MAKKTTESPFTMVRHRGNDSLGGKMTGGEVWVWLPREREQQLSPAAAEVLYEGGALARRLGAALAAYSGPVPPEADLRWLERWGVTVVRSLHRALPPHPACIGGRSLLAPLLPSIPPRAVLFSADTFGKVTAPLLAAELGAPYVADASGLTLDGDRFVAARATLGERFEAVCRLDAGRPVVVTLRPGAVGEAPSPPRISAGEKAPLQLEALPLTEGAAPPIGPAGETAPLLPPDPATLDLADAERIVAFGRGAFSDEAVSMVRALASSLGAVVAGTRPAADEGWLPFSRQIGLTGAIVRPKLYVAVGISGAPYHMVGVKEPETLIAINNDPEAPIHAHAHLSLIGELRELVPALTRRMEQESGAQPLAPGAEERNQGRTS